MLKKGRNTIKEINAKITGRQVVDGVDCIVVEWGFEVTDGNEKGTRWVYNFWVSPDRGYTLTQCKEWRVKPQSEKRELAVVAQCKTVRNGGVWVPRRYSETQYDLDRGGGTTPGISSLCVTTYHEDFAWNKAVTSDDLTLVLPSGTQVHDFALDARYTIP